MLGPYLLRVAPPDALERAPTELSVGACNVAQTIGVSLILMASNAQTARNGPCACRIRQMSQAPGRRLRYVNG